MPTTLAERLEKLEKQKARLAEREAALKEHARKGRVRTLIAAGAEVEKAGLLKLSPNALYGALLSVAAGAKDAKTIRTWERAGQAARSSGEQNVEFESIEPSSPLGLPSAAE